MYSDPLTVYNSRAYAPAEVAFISNLEYKSWFIVISSRKIKENERKVYMFLVCNRL